jgi:microcystin-dependent protein
MSIKSFNIKNSLLMSETSRQADAASGEMYYDTVKKSFATKADYWSYLESKTDIAFNADIDSTYFTESVTESSVIRITGSPTAQYNIHGLSRNNDSKIIHIYNDTNQKLIVKHESLTELVANARIITPKGTDLSIPKKSLVIFFYDDSQTAWVACQASGSGGTSFDQIQVAHGFSVLTPIYHDGTQWQMAQANASNTLATYVVTEVSTNAFTATKFGVVEVASHGLTVGEYYYVSKDTAGAITSTEPFFGYSNPVLYVQDSLNIHIMAHRPSLIGDGNVSDSEIGAIAAFPNAIEPVGFLYCDGRPVSRTTYNELFNKIGDIYGSGDGSTTFNLPDLRGKFLRGGVEFQQYSFLPAAVNTGTDIITLATHSIRHSGVKVRFSTTGTLPSPLSANTDYYVIYVSDTEIKLATSLANAQAGSAIDLTATGSGVHTVDQWLDPDAESRYALQNGGASGPSFGSYQDDAFQGHNISIPTYGGPTTSGAGAIQTSGNAADGTKTDNTITSDGTNGSPRTSFETRPSNVNIGFFIRYAPKGAIRGQDPLVAVIKDVKASGSNGGSATQNVYATRVLNTLSDPHGVVTSLSSNQFTLQAGTYLIRAMAPAYLAGGHRLRIRNITDSTTEATGATSYHVALSGTGDTVVQNAQVSGIITISGTKAFELQHYTTDASIDVTDFGIPMSTGESEVFSTVEIMKIVQG